MKPLYYIGVDFHPYQQTIAFCQEQDGEIKFRQFRHADKKALRAFYQQCSEDSLIGVEATGSLHWFETLLFELGLKLLIGNPRLIRRRARSRHKNDFRDAENILDLLLYGNFPALVPRSEHSRLILQLLNLRQTLVKQRTALANQLQALARNHGLRKFRLKGPTAKARLEAALAESNSGQQLLLEARLSLFEQLNQQITHLEAELAQKTTDDEGIQRLLTHPGVGPLTALALVHTLGDVQRFGKKEEVVAFVGLDPLDKSSGERRRFGQISKHGSRLLRFLLGQAAQTSRDARLREFYQRVSRRRGKPKAKIAAARKLLINCYIMLRDEIDYLEFCRRGEVGLCGEPRELSQPKARALRT